MKLCIETNNRRVAHVLKHQIPLDMVREAFMDHWAPTYEFGIELYSAHLVEVTINPNELVAFFLIGRLFGLTGETNTTVADEAWQQVKSLFVPITVLEEETKSEEAKIS